MPHFDTSSATLLNEEALRDDWAIEGEFDPDTQCVQLADEGLEKDPLDRLLPLAVRQPVHHVGLHKPRRHRSPMSITRCLLFKTLFHRLSYC